MGSVRRRVNRGDFFLEAAERYFPPGGSPDGRPSFEMFAAGPLRGIEALLAREFEDLPEPYPGIREWTTIETPFFAPMTFYALLVNEEVELIDLVVDQDYEWDSPGDAGADDEPH